MAYKVYLVDNSNWVELDTEQVDFTSIFAVADISDISKRKDKITKQIQFKGTPVNDNAFGSLFHLNRNSDFGIDNRLFFNYNPLRTVESLIYEDSVLLLRGSMRVLEVNVDRNGGVLYQTIVTGSFIEFRELVSEKELSDLDFTHLKHQFTWNTIKESWDVRTQRWNTSTSGYTYSPFQKGSGYVYPFIDYGVIFRQSDANISNNQIHIDNFRPGIYAKEYFDNIFQQPEISGYTYEIKGDSEMVDRFNSLVIPSNTEMTGQKSNSLFVQVSETGSLGYNHTLQGYGGTGDEAFTARAINLDVLSGSTPGNLLSTYGNIAGQGNTSWIVNRTFTSTGYVKLMMNFFQNKSDETMKVFVEFCERDFISPSDADYSNPDVWTVITSKSVTVPPNATYTPNALFEFDVPEREYKKNTILYVRFKVQSIGRIIAAEQFLGNIFTFTVSQGMFRLPKDIGGLVQFNLNYGDDVVPNPIQGVKQMDFIKSILNLFNLYVYSTKERPQHLIFQTYDDFYGFASPVNLSSNSLNWTEKIDNGAAIKIKSNVQIPKKYLFTFKDDGDYINKTYKTNWSEVYGTFQFNDSYGLTDQKKVESVFSPSPLVQYNGTKRVHPTIYQVDNGQKKPIKSNIRVLYYNGLKSCVSYSVADDTVDGGAIGVTMVATGLTSYPQVGNYRYTPGLNNMTPLEDLYWGLSKQVFFDKVPEVDTCPTAYTNFYIGQTTDLTNPNVTYMECDMYLNELDISNLDLRVPIFIDMGGLGHAYFKVINVEYSNNKSVSKVQLQKIVIN